MNSDGALFIERARAIMDREDHTRQTAREAWEKLQAEYIPKLWTWPLSVTKELEGVEKQMKRFIGTRRK